MKSAVTILLAATTLAACDAPVAPTAPVQNAPSIASTRDGVVRENYWFDNDYVFWSNCNLEQTHITGRSHVVMTTTTDGSTTTIKSHANEHLRAVGLESGREFIYNLVGNAEDTFDSAEPFPYSFSVISSQTTVVPGDGKVTRIFSIVSGTFDGTDFSSVTKKTIFECGGDSD